jgi:hypothetical protein
MTPENEFTNMLTAVCAEVRSMLATASAAHRKLLDEHAQLLSVIIAVGDPQTLEALSAHFAHRRALEGAEVAGHA